MNHTEFEWNGLWEGDGPTEEEVQRINAFVSAIKPIYGIGDARKFLGIGTKTYAGLKEIGIIRLKRGYPGIKGYVVIGESLMPALLTYLCQEEQKGDRKAKNINNLLSLSYLDTYNIEVRGNLLWRNYDLLLNWLDENQDDFTRDKLLVYPEVVEA